MLRAEGDVKISILPYASEPIFNKKVRKKIKYRIVLASIYIKLIGSKYISILFLPNNFLFLKLLKFRLTNL